MATGRRARTRDFVGGLTDMQAAQLNGALEDPDELQRELDIEIADRAVAKMDDRQLSIELRPITTKLLPAPVL